MSKKRLLTGLQPSGALHIGNYFGALKPFVDSYQEFESMLMVADYHALTTQRIPEKLRRDSLDIVKDYVAAGVDPDKAVIFLQSDIPEHMELTWILNCLVTVPFLELAHAYKDKASRGLPTNVGLFDYPVLMAADILIYDTDIVPVGPDQKQHVEYTREIASKFNAAYGETFGLPSEALPPAQIAVPGTDGKKMSKSYDNTIPLFGSTEEIKKAVAGIVTDSSGERPAIVHDIHALFSDDADIETLYERNRGNYKALKDSLAEDIERTVAPMREKRESISDANVKEILEKGAQIARARAEIKMRDVRNKIGITL